jgi:prepilin-type N-terminal cleavage/methylation domain-containing protein
MEMKATQERGFSLVEVLIAAAIFLIVALGILPFFAEAIRNNLAGRDATDVSNLGKSRVEELLQVPFDTLQIPAGTNVSELRQYYSQQDKAWKPGTPPVADPALWLRTTRIRQYNLNDLLDNGVADEPLDGGTPAGQIHFKEIEVEVRSASRNALGSGKALKLRMLRAV